MELGICALCEKEKKLVDSHIFPAFMWKSGSKQEPIQEFSLNEKYPKKRLNGIYQKLLCDTCEKIIGQYENYGRPFLERVRGITPKKPHTEVFNKFDGVKGSNNKYNYSKLKLLFLSILWRASVSSMPQYAQCDLGDFYNSQIRKLLLDNTPSILSKSTFPIAIRCYNLEDSDTSPLHIPPIKAQLKNYHKSCYFFVIHGLGVHIGVGEFQDYKNEEFMRGAGFDEEKLIVCYLSVEQDKHLINIYSESAKKLGLLNI